jgi:stringent starvation protein B
VPISNVLAIYARENGQGMAFDAEALGALGLDQSGSQGEAFGSEQALAAMTPEPPPEPTPPKGSHLRRVK